MRDLANLEFTSPRKKIKKVNIPVKFIGFASLVLGIIFILKFTGIGGVIGSSSEIRDAPRGLIPVEVSSAGVADKGVNLTTQKAVLSDVKYGGRAKGTATRSFGGGSYILSVEVTIPDSTGASWEVWLVDDSGSQREVDFMNCTKTSCSYILRDSDKYSNYNQIWITRELTKEDGAPEQHVLEGEW